MQNRLSTLIVDDELEVADILASLLEDDFDCKVFVSAHEALDHLRSNSFGLVITDLEMPGMSGIHFVKELRSFNKDVCILVSTGHESEHPKVQEALKSGASGILAKPFADPEELSAQIKAYL